MQSHAKVDGGAELCGRVKAITISCRRHYIIHMRLKRFGLFLGVSTSHGWLATQTLRPIARAGPERRRGCRALMTDAYGIGMTQEDMMNKDLLILVDGDDRVTGAMSKREAHVFSAETPRGLLHRAFSVFLFDRSGRMLLTRRAESKITFPGVWTNACCSHPLHGRVPDEVDREDHSGMPGAKHAARRKLLHELGISPEQVPHADFRFLKRFRYWAADTLTYGPQAPWGEHEMDYALFVQADVDLALNPDEVDEVRYVTSDELRAMLREDGPRWSPWFVGIMERGGWEWWANLDEALRPNGRFVQREIACFEPPDEHVAAYNLPSHDLDTGVKQLAVAHSTEVTR